MASRIVMLRSSSTMLNLLRIQSFHFFTQFGQLAIERLAFGTQSFFVDHLLQQNAGGGLCPVRAIDGQCRLRLANLFANRDHFRMIV